MELQDGAVTSVKLSDSAVTFEKLDSSVIAGISKAIGGDSGIIVGEADEEGRIVRGSGFQVARVGTGEYTLTFDTKFSSPPIVLAVAQSYGKCYLPSQYATPTAVRVKCMSDLLGSSPLPANTRFSFIVHSGV